MQVSPSRCRLSRYARTAIETFRARVWVICRERGSVYDVLQAEPICEDRLRKEQFVSDDRDRTDGRGVLGELLVS